MNFIFANRNELCKRHYIIKSDKHPLYWSRFTPNRMQHYTDLFGDDFCIIITRARKYIDAYIFPYSAVKNLFSSDHLFNNTWGIYIKNDIAHFENSRETYNVSNYYNAVDYITHDHQFSSSILSTRDVSDNLLDAIIHFNNRYREAIPTQQMQLTRMVERPGAITDYLKSLSEKHKFVIH